MDNVEEIVDMAQSTEEIILGVINKMNIRRKDEVVNEMSRLYQEALNVRK